MSLLLIIFILTSALYNVNQRVEDNIRHHVDSKNRIEVLEQGIGDLQGKIKELEQEKHNLEIKNDKLKDEVNSLKDKYGSLMSKKDCSIEELGIDTSKKTYMDYRTITNKRSKAWSIQERAVTDEDGLRVVEGYYCVALGGYENYRKQNEIIINYK